MKKVVIMVSIIILSSCSTPKKWGAIGGSKADGTVNLSYTYGMFEVPKVDEQQALDVAKTRCKNWGYDEAVGFDYSDHTCQQYNQYGCAVTIVTKQYQCK